MNSINLKFSNYTLNIKLRSTNTANAIKNILPFKSIVKTWGDEIYFEIPIEKNIDLAEPLGTETQLFIKLKNKEIISRMYNPREIKIGEQINFAVNLNKIHIFDNETKKIIK